MQNDQNVVNHISDNEKMDEIGALIKNWFTEVDKLMVNPTSKFDLIRHGNFS